MLPGEPVCPGTGRCPLKLSCSLWLDLTSPTPKVAVLKCAQQTVHCSSSEGGALFFTLTLVHHLHPCSQPTVPHRYRCRHGQRSSTDADIWSRSRFDAHVFDAFLLESHHISGASCRNHVAIENFGIVRRHRQPPGWTCACPLLRSATCRKLPLWLRYSKHLSNFFLKDRPCRRVLCRRAPVISLLALLAPAH
jgi:hypothetical protein